MRRYKPRPIVHSPARRGSHHKSNGLALEEFIRRCMRHARDKEKPNQEKRPQKMSFHKSLPL
jgi:hypothetical protein